MYTCKRIKFHSLLSNELKKHAHTLFENEWVHSVIEKDHAVEATLESGKTLYAKLIVGADGASSIVRKSFVADAPTKMSIAARAYFKNVDYPLDSIGMFSKISLPSSGIWLFPLGNGEANIGFGLHAEIRRKEGINLVDEFKKQLRYFPELNTALKNAKQVSNFKGAQIPIYNDKIQISGKRFFLIGDAASLADPLNGEGIGYAMASGRHAAEQCIACIKSDVYNAKKNLTYDKKVDKRIGKWNRQDKWILNIWFRFPFVFDWTARLYSIFAYHKTN